MCACVCVCVAHQPATFQPRLLLQPTRTGSERSAGPRREVVRVTFNPGPPGQQELPSGVTEGGTGDQTADPGRDSHAHPRNGGARGLRRWAARNSGAAALESAAPGYRKSSRSGRALLHQHKTET